VDRLQGHIKGRGCILWLRGAGQLPQMRLYQLYQI